MRHRALASGPLKFARRASVSLGLDGRHPCRAVPARRRLFQHPGRVAVVAITVLVTLNLGILLLNESDTSPAGDNMLPADVEAVTPAPNSITGLIDTVTVDLADLTGVLVIDGVEIPEDQLDRVVGSRSASGPAPARTSAASGPAEHGGREVLERPAAGPSGEDLLLQLAVHRQRLSTARTPRAITGRRRSPRP